jgi:pimeloyl-ACP methyl ester carboxylesterase
MPKPVVMTVHGIRTRGEWQKNIGPELVGEGFVPVPLDYDYFTSVAMCLPWRRKSKLDWLREAYDAVRLKSGVERPSVICHSFGTWLVGELLRRYDDVRFDAIVLAGSILPADYDWLSAIEDSRVLAVRNEMATRDVWPGVARWIPPMYGGGAFGDSGASGFTQEHDLLEQMSQEIEHSGTFYHGRFAEWARWLRQPRVPPENMERLEEAVALAHEEFCDRVGWDPLQSRLSLWVPNGDRHLVVPADIAHIGLTQAELELRVPYARFCVGEAFARNRETMFIRPQVLAAGAPDLAVVVAAPIRASDDGHLLGVLSADTIEAGILPLKDGSEGHIKHAASLAAEVVRDTYQEKTNGC